jgi:CRISPR-associated protein Cmr6
VNNMSANIGWLFNKDYYNTLTDNDYKFMLLSKEEKVNRKIEQDSLKAKIEAKIANILNQTPSINEVEVLGSTHFTATTTYPGLLLGSGNMHELPDIKGQAILGFHFDYTSGLPIIQGSSIKGVLRSAFKHDEYIQELLKDNTLQIEDLEDEIFVNGDIFFDAPISKAEGKILGDDYITPHANELKDPIPLRFIKVLPGVSFRFDFELSNGLISKAQKTKLFQNILEDLGLGAKTNVGYGKFENFSPFKTIEENKQDEKELALKKEQEKSKRLQDIENTKNEKAQRAKDGIDSLSECSTLAEAFKLLKDSFGAKPKPTLEQKEIIQAYYDKQKNISKGDVKVFKKYGINC